MVTITYMHCITDCITDCISITFKKKTKINPILDYFIFHVIVVLSHFKELKDVLTFASKHCNQTRVSGNLTVGMSSK